MPKLICNTSPLQYLHQLGLLELLPALADDIIVPEAVVRELKVGSTMGVAVPNIRELPWLNVKRPTHALVLPLITDLGRGEIEVLALGLEYPNTTLVLDDKLARNVALNLQLQITGTLGILLDAKASGLIVVVKPFLDELNALGFRLADETRSLILRLAHER